MYTENNIRAIDTGIGMDTCSEHRTNLLGRLGRKTESEHLRERTNVVLRKQLEVVPEEVRAPILLATNLA